MILAVVRHAESVENADKYNGFYQDPRPWAGEAAHALSRDVVGLTARGFRQSVWLGGTLPPVVGEQPVVFTSQYRRARDTAELAMPAVQAEVTGLLNEQHYGDATYMTMRELFATFPEGADDRRNRKHLWTPPGTGGESLALEVHGRVTAFLALLSSGAVEAGRNVVAFTHHTAILGLRAVLEKRPVTEVVEESRARKLPNAAVIVYRATAGGYELQQVIEPPA
ncbi:histidine phosphatase family protein (plasmid) [Streptomyces sp. NBC_01255]|uniref:histidine phosphatase family protein n=1 Tax=Streptomyces sp. NBC_01255 TaxID=2903798 RepID=UPI002E31429C|nr:histidine phosphatase family protein [Streptomyces sp. NBC_01255]